MKKRLAKCALLLLPVFIVGLAVRQSDVNFSGREKVSDPTGDVRVPERLVEVATEESGEIVAEAGKTGAEVLAVFEDWVSDYLEADESGRALLVAEGLALAEERRLVLKNLIQENPRRAIEMAISPEIREALPESVRMYLGQPVSGRGSLDIYGIVPEQSGEKPDRMVIRHFETEDGKYEAFVYGDWLAARTADDVFMHGIAVDDYLAVDESPVRVLSAGEVAKAEASGVVFGECPMEGPHWLAGAIAAETGDGFFYLCGHEHLVAFSGAGFAPMMAEKAYRTLGDFSVLVMRVDLSGLGESVTEADAYATMQAVDEFYQRASYDQFKFRKIHVTSEVLTVPGAVDDYLADPALLLADARQAALDAGYVTDYDFEIVAFPDIGFPWAGLGLVGGRGAWVEGAFTSREVAHELGHNMGLFHADYWQPVGPYQGNYPMDNAQKLEYGNIFDAMGDSYNMPRNHFSGNFKNLLGWLPEEHIHTVDEQAESGVYRIYRLDGGAALRGDWKYSMRIVNSMHLALPLAPVKDYWLDFRQLFQDNPRAMTGVLVQWGDDAGSSGGSHLLNAHYAGWPASVVDAPLALGETYSDPERQIHITPVMIGGTAPHDYVDVIVTRGILNIDVVRPLPEPSVVDPIGAWVVPEGGAVRFEFEAEATSSPLDRLEVVAMGYGPSGAGAVIGVAEWVEEANLYRLDASLEGFPKGLQHFRGIAYNVAGNAVSSAEILLLIDEPAISLTAAPASLLTGIACLLEATPARDDFEIGQVEFFVDGESIGIASAAPFQLEWFPQEPGEYQVTAVGASVDGRRLPSLGEQVTVVSPPPVMEFPWRDAVVDASENLYGIAVGPELMVAVGARGTILSSTNQYDWEPRLSGVDALLWGVVLGEGLWVAVGEQGTILSSPDGVTWQVEEAAGTAAFRDITYGEGLFVTVGDGGRIRYSSDGSTWIAAPSGIARNLNTVTFGGGQFVAAGSNGTIITSTDGKQWATQFSGATNDLRGVSFGNGVFVAAGGSAGATIVVSANGEDWAPAGTGGLEDLHDVHFANGYFTAVGIAGTLATSVDGVEWTQQPGVDSRDFFGVASRGDAFVVVGRGGVLSYSLPRTFTGWLAQRYDVSRLADPEVTDPLADPDNSGLANFLRYALGSDEDRQSLPVAGISTLESGAHLNLTYVRPTGLPDVRYVVEVSDNLLDWEPVQDSGGTVSMRRIGDREHIEARDGLSLDNVEGRRFLRLRLEYLEEVP